MTVLALVKKLPLELQYRVAQYIEGAYTRQVLYRVLDIPIPKAFLTDALAIAAKLVDVRLLARCVTNPSLDTWFWISPETSDIVLLKCSASVSVIAGSEQEVVFGFVAQRILLSLLTTLPFEQYPRDGLIKGMMHCAIISARYDLIRQNLHHYDESQLNELNLSSAAIGDLTAFKMFASTCDSVTLVTAVSFIGLYPMRSRRALIHYILDHGTFDPDAIHIAFSAW